MFFRVMLAASLCATPALLHAESAPLERVTKSTQSVTSWDGYYVSVFAGSARYQNDAVDLTGEEFGGSTVGAVESVSGNAAFGGLAVGYNFQNGNWVFGPELELGQLSGDALRVVNGDDGVLVEYDGLYASVAGRLGYTHGSLLIYGKAGLVWADILNAGGEYDGVGSEDNGGRSGFDGNEAGIGDGTRQGVTIGLGLEYALTNNWSIKTEYGMTKFEDVQYDTVQMTSEPFQFEDTLHTIKLGITYRF